MTLLDWFKSIAFALHDDEPSHEFMRYPLERMIQAYNAGLCIVHKYRPDLFTEWRVVKLDVGKYQDVRGCCDNVLEVADQTDADGNIIKELESARDTTTKVNTLWKKPSCITHEDAPDGYVVTGSSIDRNMNSRFTVEPPVPCDVDAYVRVKCVTKPCPMTVEYANAEPAPACDMMTALWHFVLARMLAGDRFATNTQRALTENYQLFFNILGIVEAKEDEIESREEATS